MKLYSFSGFACDGKSSLIKTLYNKFDCIYFLEHAGACLDLGKEVLNSFTDLMPFETALIHTEIERIKFSQFNQARLNKFIFFDRNLVDVITFIFYHYKISKKIKNISEEWLNTEMIENLINYTKDNITTFPVFEKNFLIEPCKDTQFIEKNCIRKDRVNTIQIEQFIDDAEWWFKKYCDLIKIFQEKLNWYNELIIIKHPTETGFDEFHKKIISLIN